MSSGHEDTLDTLDTLDFLDTLTTLDFFVSWHDDSFKMIKILQHWIASIDHFDIVYNKTMGHDMMGLWSLSLTSLARGIHAETRTGSQSFKQTPMSLTKYRANIMEYWTHFVNCSKILLIIKKDRRTKQLLLILLIMRLQSQTYRSVWMFTFHGQANIIYIFQIEQFTKWCINLISD